MTSQTHPIDVKGRKAALDAWWGADPGPTDSSYVDAMDAAIRAYLSAATPTDQVELKVVAWRFHHEHVSDQWKFAESPQKVRPWKDFDPLVTFSQSTTLLAEKVEQAFKDGVEYATIVDVPNTPEGREQAWSVSRARAFLKGSSQEQGGINAPS